MKLRPHSALAALLIVVSGALVFPARISPVQGSNPPAYRNPQLPVEQRVADLLGSMTLEEKVVQSVTLDPGQTATVELVITPDSLSFLDEQMNRVVEPGQFDIMVGSSSVDLKSVTVEAVGQ